MNKFSPNALGIATGVLWAAYVFFCGITAMFGCGPSVLGAIIGAVWGFVDGYIAGVVIAWLYNKLAK
jgi:hypothetical protein